LTPLFSSLRGFMRWFQSKRAFKFIRVCRRYDSAGVLQETIIETTDDPAKAEQNADKMSDKLDEFHRRIDKFFDGFEKLFDF
jgi:hypothetical protein